MTRIICMSCDHHKAGKCPGFKHEPCTPKTRTPRCLSYKNDKPIKRVRRKNIAKARALVPKVLVFDKELHDERLPGMKGFATWTDEVHMKRVEIVDGICSFVDAEYKTVAILEPWCRYVDPSQVRG